mmetsp:Transcript_40601/g.91583  ORF Transcript_40601/g.91583 Transcript_40601/m.91583 type:complete len:353 (+) Transcript_40601:66-1124(+)
MGSCCSALSGEAVEDSADGPVKALEFQPGRLGIAADWTTGLLTEVTKGGQAERLGIHVGWQLQSVNGQPYSEVLLLAAVEAAKPFMVVFRKEQPGRAQLHNNTAMNAHNVWTFPIKSEAIEEAARLFKEEVLPEYLSAKESGLQALGSLPVKCSPLKTISGGRFLATQPLSFPSDIAWISVDDEGTYRQFERLAQQSGILEQCSPMVDHDRGLRIFNSYFVVRSVAHDANMHCDYVKEVGTDALTLMTPITPRLDGDRGFNLLYRSLDGELHTYTYRKGEAVVFGAGFEHSTEPGESAEPSAFLCFTFGTDREELWPQIARTINTQSRIVCTPSGQLKLSRLGQCMERGELS